MRGPENSARAADVFQQVVSAAPEHAPAWAALASALAQLSRPSMGEEIIPPDPRLGPAALKALQLDRLLAEAHASLANTYARVRNWANARMSFLKTLALNPSLTHNHFVLGVLMPLGDTEALHVDRQRRARVDRPPADQHRAGAAGTAIAAALVAREIRAHAERIQQGYSWLNHEVELSTVDGQPYRHFARAQRRRAALCRFGGRDDGRGEADNAGRFQEVAAAEVDAVRGIVLRSHPEVLSAAEV
jgi:tetratricopeptide (TPR) repeat protein